MGATTYEWVLEHDNLLEEPQNWHDMYGDVPCWVFTHRTCPRSPDANVFFVSPATCDRCTRRWSPPPGQERVAGRRRRAGRRVRRPGLLDEIILGVAPVTLGAGAPVLPRRLPASVLSLVSVEQEGQFAYLTYAVRRGS